MPKRWLKGAFSWAIDQAIERWPSIVILVGGSIMSYLAAISHWLAPYGPVAWGAVGIASVLVLALIYWLYGTARVKIGVSDYVRAKAQTAAVNVLAPTHNNERIDLPQFFHPFYKPTEHVRFENCELFGPASLVIDGCTIVNSGFFDCELVIARPDRPIKGAMVFKHCTITRCSLFRVTFLMKYDTYKNLPDEMKKGLVLISDGRIGDI